MSVTSRAISIKTACIPLVIAFLFVGASVSADGVSLSLRLPDRIRVSERSNLSRTEDGRYRGLTNRQTTGYLTREPGGPDSAEAGRYVGRVLVFEQTLRDTSRVGRRVDQSYEGTAVLDPGRAFADSAGLTAYQGIPRLLQRPVVAGESWSAPGMYVLNLPHGRGEITLEVEVSYRYEGTEVFGGELVHRIVGQFAARYPPRLDPEAAGEPDPPLRPDIIRISGRHSLTILVPADSLAPFFIRDEIEEQYELEDAPVTLVRGHRLLFVYGLSLQDQQSIAERVERQLRQSGTQDVIVDQTATGTRVTVQNIRFLPDQAVIIPDDRGRLALVAAALESIPGVRFLVVGHTADVGTKESQVTLSWQRAQVVVNELVGMGLDPLRFDMDGRGGEDPVAPNDTEDGRARNRRVEIYILEE